MTRDIHYSVSTVGASTDLKNGGAGVTISITGGTGTFNIVQTGNIGIGCEVIYGTTNSVFISSIAEILSGGIYKVNLINKTGIAPSNTGATTVNFIYYEFASLSAASTALEDTNHLGTDNLITGDYRVYIWGYKGTSTHNIGTWNNLNDTGTDENRRVIVATPTGGHLSLYNNRHSGIPLYYTLNQYFQIDQNTTQSNSISDDYMVFSGIVFIRNQGSFTQPYMVTLNGPTHQTGVTFDQCLFSGTQNPDTQGELYGIRMAAAGGKPIVRNCLFLDMQYGIRETSALTGIRPLVQNCTFFNCGSGYYSAGTGNQGVIQNSIFASTNTGIYKAFAGTKTNLTVQNCATAEATGTNPIAFTTGQLLTNFVNYSGKNFHLVQNAPDYEDVGLDLSAYFTYDVDSDYRGTSWSIGFDEYYEEPAAPILSCQIILTANKLYLAAGRLLLS